MPEGIKTSMYWVLGIGVIALIGLIMLILFGNLSGNVGFGTTSSVFTNETISINGTGGTPTTASGRTNGALSSLVITNATGGETISSGNYTVTGVVITNATGDYADMYVNVSGTVTYDTAGKINTDNLISNYTLSVTNVSEQFPTTGTIIGVALLLVVLLGILIFAIKKMMGVANVGSSSKGSFNRGSDGGFG